MADHLYRTEPPRQLAVEGGYDRILRTAQWTRASSVLQVNKGARWMPWYQEPKKDVGACDKPRESATRLRSGDFRMGKPAGVMARHPCLNT